MSHGLGYYRRKPRSRHRGPSLWLVAGAAVALTGFGLKLAVPRREVTREEIYIAAAESDVSTLSTAIGSFASDVGRYPTRGEGLAVLASAPVERRERTGPYMRQLKSDPWGRPYVFHPGGPKGGEGYRIFSVGPDGKEGTRDDIRSATDAAPVARTAPGGVARGDRAGIDPGHQRERSRCFRIELS